MSAFNNPDLLPLAKKLRREMTPHERKLWYLFLRNYPVKFYKQKVIQRFIVDFFCPGAKLVIEVDGSQHYEDSGVLSDKQRDQALQELGLGVLRFSNREINRAFAAVCRKIDDTIKERLKEEA